MTVKDDLVFPHKGSLNLCSISSIGSIKRDIYRNVFSIKALRYFAAEHPGGHKRGWHDVP
jgi:hypothetical protein